eukprot:CAMPEP_0204584800 /NCGR_PEP_ID=MMETSP0661-20131031/46547_1 /ASSEMBLY_ACC=CAM_ASM_000606 /TAXON_ID=109239 /ORGANISM="Alexandrium margalefi, Strain AMGDE01CS-322" /LENGTH=273 /DNA_ID=CAMNT_0051594285 /DNA_START=58 /DNA_END=879 /DNA_ORIENTATION=+
MTWPFTVESLWVAPKSADDMQPRQTVRLIEGVGIEGDRYATGAGTYSVMHEPGRQLTLLSADGAEAALAKAGLALRGPLGGLRRNVVLRGISPEALLGAVGHTVELGSECAVFVHRNCVPCKYNEARNAAPGLMEALWDASGVNCQVVRGGTLRCGDECRVMPAHEPERVDTGGKPADFFVRPGLRTSASLAATRRGLAALSKSLSAVDRAGVERVEAAYNSVGLRFWPGEEPDSVRTQKARAWLARGALIVALPMLAATLIALRRRRIAGPV